MTEHEYARAIKAEPSMRAARNGIARALKDARRESPAFGRALRRRINAAREAVAADFIAACVMGEMPQRGHMSKFIAQPPSLDRSARQA